MSLLGPPKEKRTQLYFRDDGSFIFRKLEVEEGFLVEKQGKEIIRAWVMKYKLLKRFDGFKGIGADMVTLSFARDIILDPFNQLKDGEKPEKGDSLVKDFVRKIATAKCYKHEHKAKGSTFTESIIVYLGITMVLLGLAIGVKGAWG